ncbi:helix-turn-helix domain-containing protein [Streptomyces sp. 1331.2]|uniref:helix-turn-helix domain-containing protein n=1 Tax=Streptomyces sp. 1331.2 TaxID=1938835 RepID=UPI000BDC5A7E|nr:helix-turn-helix transcriptional regulator [Streptomyces sp. 1331.2]SOB85451.1 Helix-turn-helix domain-containing protein [Streptomyces sp. 1331.2]
MPPLPAPTPHQPAATPPRPRTEPESARLRFGRRLRHWREARGLSQTEFGRLLGYHNSLISRVENARRWPPPGLPARADELLLAGGELAALWQTVRQERERLDELAAATRPPLAADAAPPDAATVEVLAHLLTGYRAAACRIGGEELTAVLEHHARTLAGWQHTAPRTSLAAVRSLAAQYAELAGWAHFEGDRCARALSWYATGLEWAHATGDRATTAALLARQSTLHWWSGDPATALALAEAARAAAPPLPELRAWAAVAKAHAHALVGEAPQVRQALADAHRLTEAARHSDGPTPWSARADLVLAVAHGTCHRDLAVHTGRPAHARTAAARLEAALALLDPAAHPRDHTLVTARLAGAHAHAGHPDAAAALLARLPPGTTGRIAREQRRAREWLRS